MTDMYIIAGLGNPGGKYDHTRHNTGFEVIDILSDKWDIKVTARKHKALCGTGIVGGEKVMLMKPETFMNLSGESVKDAVDFYKSDVRDKLIVVYDDVDLPVGKLRIRPSGSAGGHNGMKDIISRIGTEDFTRVRVGVGARPEEFDLVDWVLSRFSPEDEKIMEEVRKKAADSIEDILSCGADHAMSRYNG